MYNLCVYEVICVKSITLIESTQSKGRVPMNRPRYNDDRCQRHYVPRTGHRNGRRSNQAQRNARSSYWFPVVTMIAAILFAASSIIPRLFFSAFAGEQKEYAIHIASEAGSYSITLTGANFDINLDAEQAPDPKNNEDGTFTFDIKLDRYTEFSVSSSDLITNLMFGDGASVVKSIDANDSGVSSIDISKCTGLKSLYLKNCPIVEIDVNDHENLSTLEISGCTELKALKIKHCNISTINIDDLNNIDYINAIDTPFATFENAYALDFPKDKDCDISINPPQLIEAEGGIEFDVIGLGDESDLTLVLNDGTPVEKKDGKYFISISKLKEISETANGEVFVFIQNIEEKPNVGFFTNVYRDVLPDPNSVPGLEESGIHFFADSKSVANNQSNTDSKSNTVSQSDAGDDQNTPNVALEINKDSKSIIKNAYIENVEGIDAKSLQIIAKAPSAADKKSFLAAIKNADKNFDDSDANLMVYDIYVADSKGSKVSVKGKAAVTLDLAFPSKTVSFMYDEYNYKVYHQLDDKSIDTSIHAYGTKDGIQLTTDSFSLLAISSTKDESGYTDLTIDDKSKSIIKSAKIHKNTTFSIGTDVLDSSVVKITAVALSSDQKTALINAIKKADSKFKADNNLIAYDVKIVDDDGKTVTVNGKVDFTLAYPSDTIAKNISKYDLTVYHQLSDSSINTNPVAVGVKDGVTVTTDSFSNFAVAFTTKSGESDIPATGESDVMMEIAILLSIISLLSFISIYAKNRSVQY